MPKQPIGQAKILRSAAELIKNLRSAGRYNWENNDDKMTRPDILTKKPPKSKIIDDADPIEPGSMTEESITTKGKTYVKTTNNTLDIARTEGIWGLISMATPQINCTPVQINRL